MIFEHQMLNRLKRSNDKWRHYQADSDVASADNPAAISIDHKNPIPRNIFRYIRNLKSKSKIYYRHYCSFKKLFDMIRLFSIWNLKIYPYFSTISLRSVCFEIPRCLLSLSSLHNKRDNTQNTNAFMRSKIVIGR